MSSETYTVVSTMKNEGPYILEWVAHYKALGFDHLLICTNDCTDTTVEILKRLEEMGLVTHHPTIVRGGGIHRSALRQASRRYDIVRDAKWVFVCDVDEFLNIHVGDGSARALVEASSAGHQGSDGPPDVISVPWRIFGPDGVEGIADHPVTGQFARAEFPHDPVQRPDTGRFVKSIYTNQDKFQRMGLHAPVPFKAGGPSVRCVFPGGAPRMIDGARTEVPPSFEIAQVNHYALRSLDSYLVKRARGRANHSHHVLGLEYWDKFDRNDVEDRSIRRYEARAGGIRAELHADPVLADLHARALDWHRRKAASIRMDPDNDALVTALAERLHAGQAPERQSA